MLLQKKSFIILSVIFVAGALAVWWFFRPSSANDIPTEQFATSTPTNTLGGAKFELVPIKDALPPTPSLNRTIPRPKDMPEEAFKLMEQKIAALTLSLKENPNSPEDWLKLGANRKIMEDFIGAREAWEFVTYLSPNHYLAYANLGDLYHFYLKNYPASEKNLRQAVKLKPDYIAGWRALYDLYHLSYKEKADQAPVVLKEGISKNPNNIELLVLLGLYHKREIGDIANAKIYLSKALELARAEGNTSLVLSIESELSP